MLIGLPDLAKERKASKIVINGRLPKFLIFPLVFVKGRHFTILINSKLISELVSSDKTVILYINATQV